MITVNGKAIRVRGGSRFRPSRKETHHESSSKVVLDAGAFWECSEGHTETIVDHIVPRRSLTSQQGLRLFAPHVELEDQRARVLDHKSGELVEITNPKVTWRSDRTLLLKGRPEQLSALKVTRVTSKNKIRRFETEGPAVIETPTDNEIDEI